VLEKSGVADGRNRKILVVDDKDDWCDLLMMVIRRAGYEVIQAATSSEAMIQAAGAKPDLILLNLGVPGMDTDNIMSQLKINPSTRDIPVIVETVQADNPNVRRAVSAGAKEVLCKPFDLGDLPGILRNHFAGQSVVSTLGPSRE
jgi:two-component system, OmpR family, KDP operon response regulator KdpE